MIGRTAATLRIDHGALARPRQIATVRRFWTWARAFSGDPLGNDLADTFVRFESDGQCFEVPIERLGVCGFGRALSNTVVHRTMASPSTR